MVRKTASWFIVDAAGVILAWWQRCPIHWTTVGVIGFQACVPLSMWALARLMDRTFQHAERFPQLDERATELAVELSPGSRRVVFAVWSVPTEPKDGFQRLELRNTAHIALGRKSVEDLPASRDFVLALAVDAFFDHRTTGKSGSSKYLWNLVNGVLVLLGARFGGWIIAALLLSFGFSMALAWWTVRKADGVGAWTQKLQYDSDRRAVRAVGEAAGAISWLTTRIANSQGEQRQALLNRLAELERNL